MHRFASAKRPNIYLSVTTDSQQISLIRLLSFYLLNFLVQPLRDEKVNVTFPYTDETQTITYLFFVIIFALVLVCV